MFRDFLQYKNPILDDDDDEEQTGPIEALQVGCHAARSCAFRFFAVFFLSTHVANAYRVISPQ